MSAFALALVLVAAVLHAIWEPVRQARRRVWAALAMSAGVIALALG